MKISVVMATYNGGVYLEQQIESILAQTLKPVEFIVCDDRSTDYTIQILERYQQEKKLSYFINDRQLGVIGNFKKAVSLAQQDNYIALSDQDDQWLPDKLEKSALKMSALDVSDEPCLVYTDLLLVDQQEKVLNTSFRNEHGQDKYQHTLKSLLFGNFVNGCTTLMNPLLTTYFADIPEEVRLNHDGWIALAGFTFGKAESIPESLVRYRKHDHNVSIAADLKPRNRYRSTLEELYSSLKGDSSFLSAQMETVRKFYNFYQADMTADKRVIFERFLQLESKSYLLKKLTFKRMVNHFKT